MRRKGKTTTDENKLAFMWEVVLIPGSWRASIISWLGIEGQTLDRMIPFDAFISLRMGISISLTLIEEWVLRKISMTVWLLKNMQNLLF